MSRNARDLILYVFCSFLNLLRNNDELELLYRALAFAQSNFPQTLEKRTIVHVSHYASEKKKKKKTYRRYISLLQY